MRAKADVRTALTLRWGQVPRQRSRYEFLNARNRMGLMRNDARNDATGPGERDDGLAKRTQCGITTSDRLSAVYGVSA